MPSSDLQRLLRWEVAGGTWRVVSARSETIEIELLSCGGAEAMDTITSTAPNLYDFVGRRLSNSM